MSTTIACATMADLFEWEVDDRPLVAALEALGCAVEEPVWDDPGVAWEAFDAVLIRTTWDYQDKLPAFLAWVDACAARTRLFNPPQLVRWSTHKSYLRALRGRGVRMLPTRFASAGEALDLGALCREMGWSRGFIKPLVGASARETLRFSADPVGLDAAQAHADRLLATEDLMVQPYVDSVESFGELSAIFFDGRYSHGVRKIPVPGDYRVMDDFGASDEPWGFAPEEIALARGIVDEARSHLELDAQPLYARVDFLRDDEGHLCLNELELVEPSLFFRHGPGAAKMLAEALLTRL